MAEKWEKYIINAGQTPPPGAHPPGTTPGTTHSATRTAILTLCCHCTWADSERLLLILLSCRMACLRQALFLG